MDYSIFSLTYGNFNAPVCIFNETGEKVWSNKAFDEQNHQNGIDVHSLLSAQYHSGKHMDFHVEQMEFEGVKHTIAIKLNRVHSKLEELEIQARTDALTQVSNKIYFMQELNSRLDKAKNNKTPLCVVFIDLDNFKPINDTYGHAAGDAVLVHFAYLMKLYTRGNDVVARLGGDEFAMILDADFNTAVAIVKRLESNLTFTFEDNVLHFGISAGIVSADSFHTVDSLLAQADTLMYDRKKHKRKQLTPKKMNRYLDKPIERELKLKMPFPLPLDFVLENTLDNIPYTEIKTSEVHGFGLFATEDIPVQMELCKLTGQIMSRDEYAGLVSRLTELTGDLSFYFLVECNHVLNPHMLKVRAFRTKWSYVNHSTTPNCFFDINSQSFYPLRDIKKGEELTFDYRVEPLSEDYLKKNEDWLISDL